LQTLAVGSPPVVNVAHLFGEWRQARPSTGRDAIFIRFEEGGRFVWTIEGDALMSLELTWSLSGNTLTTQRPGEPGQQFTVRFESPAALVLERAGIAYRYVR
jgi:hypothetical protein